MKIESIVLRELGMTLVQPFATSFGETRERRVLLVEVRGEGISGWGECTVGEHPFFNEESTDTAWLTILQELAPMLASSENPTPG
jgi:o-succinylbenzoate synthase